jgi:hypothetical protein
VSEPIQVTSHVSRDFLQNSAYFNTVPKVVWEYVSNSIDNPKPNEPVNVEVRISRERIVVSDDGCGMSREGLRNFFQMHAENIQRQRGRSVRGRYGTGKCAAFGVADVLRVETCQDGVLNVVDLSRKDIIRARSGEPFPVRDIVLNKFTTQEDGTRVIISQLNIKNIELSATIAYVERHLGRQLHNHKVWVNDHVCEYQEPNYSQRRVFRPSRNLVERIGDVQLVIKVSPVPLDKERAGIDVLSKGIWHDTTLGSLEADIARRIFGEADMPALEEKYDTEKIPPFDNTRNMTLNLSNPLVVSLLGWIDECLHEVARELIEEEKERKASDEAKRLAKQAHELENLLNRDFRSLEMELERIRRVARIRDRAVIEELVPGLGTVQTDYQIGGPEHGDGTRGELAGLGEEERPGSSILAGSEMGSPGKMSERKQPQSTFHVDYRREQERSPRSHYESESRTIVINLDHPQIARSAREGGGIDGKQFQEMTREVAFVEYAIALGYEKLRLDEFYDSSDTLLDIRDTINRVSRAI